MTSFSRDAASKNAGEELRARVETLGSDLRAALQSLVAVVPRSPVGPQALGRALGTTTVTASRFLKAIAQTNPIAVLQLLPGPNPMRKMIAEAVDIGAPAEECEQALEKVLAFDELIRTEAGDRGALKAMLSAWLPEDRGEFEGQRRQTIFKALNELEGVSCDLEIATIILHPSSEEDRIDVVSLQGQLGIDRIRPDAVVRLGTRRVPSAAAASAMAVGGSAPDPAPTRLPQTLDGSPAAEGLHTVRLDEFCAAPPAPLESQIQGDTVDYFLGPTGFGRGSKVDLVIAEVNRAELARRSPDPEYPPFFFTCQEMPTRKLLFDLLVHPDVFGGAKPEVFVYNLGSLGPAVACNPTRALDARPCTESMQDLGTGLGSAGSSEFDRYPMLLEHVGAKLNWDLSKFQLFRIAISYPLVGQQIALAFTTPS